MSRNPFLTILMLIVGIILVLPGICSLIFVVRLATDSSTQWHHPIVGLLVPLWGFTVLVAVGGIFLIRAAVPDAASEREPPPA
jgi:hypothetical protein